MLGIYFFLQIGFAILMLWAVTSALYMGIFHAHRETVAMSRKNLAAVVSVILAGIICYLMYSWSYLSW